MCNSDYLNFVTADSNCLLTLSTSITWKKSSAHQTNSFIRTNPEKCELKNVLKVKTITFHRLTEYFGDKSVLQQDQKGQNSMFAVMVTR